MSRSPFTLTTLFFLTATVAFAQSSNGLLGTIEGNIYISPRMDYSIKVPVLPELGGSVKDTPTVVVFQDAYNMHVSVGAFPMDATQRWQLSTDGVQTYLLKFFKSIVMPDFIRMYPGSVIESSAFQAEKMGGALRCFTLIPGGSMFAPGVANLDANTAAPVAKRGNLVFIQNHIVYVVSMELAERSLEGRLYNKTTQEEDTILWKRLRKIVSTMRFAKPKEKESPANDGVPLE